MRGHLSAAEIRLLPLRYQASIARSQWHFYSSASTIICGSDDHHQNPPWTASNHLFHKHPRLHSLERCNSLHCLNPILAYSIVSGLFRNAFVASRILHSITTITPRNPSLAFSIFSQMSRPNLFSWNAMIKALATTSAASHGAISLFVEMRRKGVSPGQSQMKHRFLLMNVGHPIKIFEDDCMMSHPRTSRIMALRMKLTISSSNTSLHSQLRVGQLKQRQG